jgi:magnesium chelatase family protein
VVEARQRQRRRLAGTNASSNGDMDGRLVRSHVQLEPPAEDALARAYTAGALSARGRHRVLRVARTVADLREHDLVSHGDLMAALSLRQPGRSEAALAA